MDIPEDVRLSVVNGTVCEQSLIGCCVVGGSKIFLEVSAVITADVFVINDFKVAFEVMATLVRNGVDINVITVSLEWKKARKDKVPNSILYSPDACAAPCGWEYFKEIIVEDYEMRVMSEQATLVVEASKDPMSSVEDVRAMLDKVAFDSGITSKSERGKQLAESNLDYIQKKFQTQGELQGVSTGFDALDQITEGLAPGEVSVIAARPGVGKTAFALSLIYRAVYRGNAKVLFVSLEMSKDAIMSRLTAMEASIPFSNLRTGKLTDRDFASLMGFTQRTADSPLCVLEGAAMTIREIGDAIRREAKTYGTQLVVIDYIQIIRSLDKSKRRSEQLAAISNELNPIARNTNTHVCVLAQVNRESAKDDRVPGVHEIAETDQIERDADLVMLLHRPKDESGFRGENASVHVVKQRSGQTGAVDYYFNSKYVRFDAVAKIHEEDIPGHA